MILRRRHVRDGTSDIYYQASGSGDAVVLVHGLSGSSRWWRRNVEALGERFRVYVIDLMRFGRSRSKSRFVLTEAAASLVGWMDRIGLERASFVGHSMGGLIVADLAGGHPDRVERLVLVDPAVLLVGRSYLGHVVGLARAIRRLPMDFYPVLFTDALAAGPQTILQAGLELVSTDVTERLSQIRAPVLIVWGERDTAVPLSIGQRLRDVLPRSRFVVIKGAGHNPMWDRPAEFNRIVLDFLSAPQLAASPS